MDNTNADFEVVFDGGGGITLQTEDYVHHYEDEKHAAEGVKQIMDDPDTSYWEGNNPDHRLEYGLPECIFFDKEDIIEALSQEAKEYSSSNIHFFFAHLRSMMGSNGPETA